ncbi:HNH endonuclease [Nannocystis pusilla]|uniref:HNH endonuclease n=1 Tax=Nannocystis pusilla TaxID=889268 RepID=UPI003BF308EB
MADYLYGEGGWTQEDLAPLRVIVKRIRQYVTVGRRVTTLSTSDYLALLSSQNGRCRLCGYRFRVEDLDARDYTDEPAFQAQGLGLRPPHVDHVIPIFIGGDRRSNLQVLCSTCNLSKSSLFGWFTSRVSLSAGRPSDVFLVTRTERWAVLSRDGACRRCGILPQDLPEANDELTVARKDSKRGWLFENLEAVCTACSCSYVDVGHLVVPLREDEDELQDPA